MKKINNYTFEEIFSLSPVVDFLKQIRNDKKQKKFLATYPNDYDRFLESLNIYKNKNIGITVAFNSSWVIEKLIYFTDIYFEDTELIIFDNSNREKNRLEIKAFCYSHNIKYFALPENPEKHPCRSHGLALNWIYYNIIRNVKPNIFAFIDHDLIPFKRINFSEIINDQAFYGLINPSQWAWNLWAGYSLFKFDRIKDLPLNFNNDRPNGLDTGGRNWKPLYSKFDRQMVKFALNSFDYKLVHSESNSSLEVEVIDNKFVHLCGVMSDSESFDKKIEFYNKVFKETMNGKKLSSLFQLN